MNEEIHLFLSYAAADEALATPLLDQLRTVQEHHSYFFVEGQHHGEGADQNETLLAEATMLVLVVSRSYFRDPFYRGYLRRRTDLPGRLRVETLWMQPLIVTNEPLLRLVAPPMAERTALESLRKESRGRLEAYYDELVERWVAAGWRNYLGHKREQEEAERRRLLAQAEADRRRDRLTVIGSATGLLLLVLFIFFGDYLLPSADSPPMAGPGIEQAEEEAPPPPEQALIEEPTPELNLPTPLPPPMEAAPETTSQPPPAAVPKARPSVASPQPRGNPGQYLEHYNVGEGRIVALLPGRVGWLLLDADWRPVSEQRYRRVYYKPGFVDGKLKVKIGEEIVFIDRMGRRVGG